MNYDKAQLFAASGQSDHMTTRITMLDGACLSFEIGW